MAGCHVTLCGSKWLCDAVNWKMSWRSVLQSTASATLLHSTTRYYKVLVRTPRYYKVLLHSTTQYYTVLQSTTQYYSSTTQYYKLLLQYHKVLLQYYKVFLRYYKILFRTTEYTTKYDNVLQSIIPFDSPTHETP